MAQFILRDIDALLWQRVTVRAQMEGWPLQQLVTQLLDDYVHGRASPSRPAPAPQPPQPAAGVVTLRFTCPKCNRMLELDARATVGFGQMSFYAVECPSCQAITERALPGDPVGDPRPAGKHGA